MSPKTDSVLRFLQLVAGAGLCGTVLTGAVFGWFVPRTYADLFHVTGGMVGATLGFCLHYPSLRRAFGPQDRPDTSPENG